MEKTFTPGGKFLFSDLPKDTDFEMALESRLREEILGGSFEEGLKLPSTTDWAKALQINDRKLQRVLRRLAAQGFLERRPHFGTYVRRRHERPTVVILVGFSLVTEHVYYMRNVVAFLITKLKRLNYNVEVIDDLFALFINDLNEQKMRLSRFRDRLLQIAPSGYVECSFDLSRLPDLYPHLKRPLVSFYPTTSGGDVYFDEQAFVRNCLKYLASKGRRKVLLVRSAGRLGPIHHATGAFWKSVDEFGFLRGTFRELYHGAIGESMEKEAHDWMIQLAESWKGMRKNYIPDCMVVSDDIVMRGLATGLYKSGVKIPEDLLIVTQANEEARFRYEIPVVYCEVPLEAIAQSLANLLDARINQKKLPKSPILLTQTRIIENAF